MEANGTADLLIKGFTAFIALVAVGVALKDFKRTVSTKTSEFLLTLHKAFFADTTYDRIRCLLDDTDEAAQVELAGLVANQADEFIKFLNFLELVAYMRKSHTLKYRDVEALFGYYLEWLQKNPAAKSYIKDRSKSFEHLAKLLDRVAYRKKERDLLG